MAYLSSFEHAAMVAFEGTALLDDEQAARLGRRVVYVTGFCHETDKDLPSNSFLDCREGWFDPLFADPLIGEPV